MGIELEKKIHEVRTTFSKTVAQETEYKDDAAYPREAEPAMVHPLNSSMFKIRENGMIDIFVGTDNGLRIDPETKTINLLSNITKQRSYYSWDTVKRNATQNIGHDSVTNIGNDEIHNVKKNWTVHVGGNANLISDQTIYMEAREKIHLKSPYIHLDATLPPDEMDPVRPPLGLMFEEDKPYGEEPPFGYRPPYGHFTFEKKPETYTKGFATALTQDYIWEDKPGKPRYRREEYNDLHEDEYEKWVSYRQMDPFATNPKVPLLEVIKERKHESQWTGKVLREKYKKGKIQIDAMHQIELDVSQDIKKDITTNEKKHRKDRTLDYSYLELTDKGSMLKQNTQNETSEAGNNIIRKAGANHRTEAGKHITEKAARINMN